MPSKTFCNCTRGVHYRETLLRKIILVRPNMDILYNTCEANDGEDVAEEDKLASIFV